jgi:hypothetical protein
LLCILHLFIISDCNIQLWVSRFDVIWDFLQVSSKFSHHQGLSWSLMMNKWINGRIPARSNAGNSYYTRMLRSCRVYRKRVKRESVTIIILMLKLRQNSFVLKLIYITFPDSNGKVSTQVVCLGFKIWSLVGYWCSSRNGNITADMRKRGQRKRV